MHAGVFEAAASTRERQWAAWMPCLASVMFALTMGYVLLVFDGWHKLFRDSDTGWHIRTGESILMHHALPRNDVYSFSREGAPWVDWEWGSDVLTALAYRLGGLPAVALLFAAAIGACSWLWFQLTWQAGGDFLLACALSLPMLSTVNMHWLARPHLWGWVLLLIWMICMERGCKWWVAMTIGAVWANVHASFFLGPVVGLLYVVGQVCNLHAGFQPVPGRLKTGLRDAAAFLAGTLINPYGLGLHRHVAAYLTDSELLDRIGEFQSFNFHAAGAGWVLATIAICGVGAVAALNNRRIEHFLVSAFFIAVALRSARGLPIAALCVLPLANANIAGALRRARGLAPRLRERLDAALAYSGRLRGLDRSVSGWAIVPLVLVAFTLAANTAHAGFSADQFPVAASDAVAGLPPASRLLAPDHFGGYLIYRFEGRRKIFFDGRSDFYGSPFMKEYLRLMEARPGWPEIVARYRFTHALLPADAPLIPALSAAGWTSLYKDTTAALLAAPAH